jgi:mono/diheme cytochrome c family protein
MSRLSIGFLLVAVILSSPACLGDSDDAAPHWMVGGGDARRGRQLIQDYGCGSCHTVPGIRSAKGLVGPPLLWWSKRTVIAGAVPNTPDNLIQFIRVPQSITARTIMPPLGLSDQQARDVAAYLYTLR